LEVGGGDEEAERRRKRTTFCEIFRYFMWRKISGVFAAFLLYPKVELFRRGIN
jgi:hypothetical protein